MGSNPRSANGSRRRSLLKRMRAVGAPCWICGLPIDYSLPARHPLSFECDELVPVSRGGSPYDPANCAAAHRCCNQWRSNRSVQTVERMRGEARERFGAWASPQAFCEAMRALKSSQRSSCPVRHPKRSSGLL